jgi:hypothetical protein
MDRTTACDHFDVVGTHFQGVPNFASFLGRLGEPSLPTSAICECKKLSCVIGVFDSTLGGEINGKTSQPVSTFIVLARDRCQSGATMSVRRGLQGWTAWIV